jgi:general secretion pathway protein E
MSTDQLLEIIKQTADLSEESWQALETARAEGILGSGKDLVEKKIISESQLLEAYSHIYQLAFWPELPMDNLHTNFPDNAPIQFLKKYMMLPMGNIPPENYPGAIDAARNTTAPGEGNGNTPYIIAINDPTAVQPLDDLIRILDIDDYEMVLSTRGAIISAINISHDLHRSDSAEQMVQDMEEDGSTIISQIEDTADLLDDTSDAPIIRLVNHIISQATKAHASDVHIEPYQDSFKVRFRVDGILHDFLTPPKWVQSALISRIKVMAQMNIAEKRLPQDSRIDVKVGNQEVDIRVSTLPIVFGERVVMRLLNKSGSLMELSELGISAKPAAILKKVMASPNGIFLVTGPTGSGKTTTLYAVLSTINHPGINIITVEDPVEYQIQGINQIQVNPKIDLTFARGLRSIVRQDPDVILVGEIRDKETADIAVQSALTGHLVFSTLHTNDAASAITRLVDIGIEPFLISSVVIAVAAQRLIRVLCDNCKESYEPDEVDLASLGVSRDQLEGKPLYRAAGCPKCFHTGYKGRVAIFEIMEMSQSLKSLILKTFDAQAIMAEALKSNTVTLRQDGIQKVLDGISTIEEVIRVTAQV